MSDGSVLSCLLNTVRGVEGHVGRDATDPRILLALWIYATLQALASARALAKLCDEHLAFRWLCGGLTVNHRLLSEFRSRHAEEFNVVLRDMVAALLTTGLVTLQSVAQDGMRTRASAGSSSFRSQPKLHEDLQQWVNAQCCNHGLRSYLVRGRRRCLSVALLHALACNLMTVLRLQRAS